MKFGIPSYHRPECKTVDTLIAGGIDPSDIFVALQGKKEVERYKELHPNVNFLLREADCAAGNRNTLIDALETPFVLLDDDITSIAEKLPGGNFRGAEWRKIVSDRIPRAIETAEENGCQIIGIAPTTNSMVARGRGEYSYDCVLQGSFLVMLEPIKFNEKWKMVEDYEIALRTIRRGGHTLRANWLSVRKPKNGTNQGGLHERYASGELQTWISRLAQVYPEFKPNKDKLGGYVRFG